MIGLFMYLKSQVVSNGQVLGTLLRRLRSDETHYFQSSFQKSLSRKPLQYRFVNGGVSVDIFTQ
jgi:hypothetical protein